MNRGSHRIASLDLGTSCLLLLVAQTQAKSKLKVLLEEGQVPRIGEGLAHTGKISSLALERTGRCVEALAHQARALGVDELLFTATHAAREASNQAHVVSYLSQAANCPLRVLSEQEEARRTYLSVSCELEKPEPCIVVDIGGGSTEISWGNAFCFEDAQSLDLGTIKLRDRFLHGAKPTVLELAEMRNEIRKALAKAQTVRHRARCFGTAGSFTHLAAIDAGLVPYQASSIAHHKLLEERVKTWTQRFAEMEPKELVDLPGADPRRIDTLLPGTLIIESLYPLLQQHQLEVLDRGVRFGTILDHCTNLVFPVQIEE